MTTPDVNLRKLLEASPLFTNNTGSQTDGQLSFDLPSYNNGNQMLDLDELSEEQAINIARKNNAVARGGKGYGGISGGITLHDKSLIDATSKELRESPEVITSNVQQYKKWRRDPRTQGGELAAQAPKGMSPPSAELPEMPEMPALPENTPPASVAAGMAPSSLAALSGVANLATKTAGKEAASSLTSAPVNASGGLTGMGGSFLNPTVAASLGTIGADSIAAQTAAQATGMHPALFGAPGLTQQMIAMGPSSGLPGATSAGAAASSAGTQAAGMTLGKILPIAGFGIQAYNILKMGGVFGDKGKKGGVNYEQLLRDAEAGKKSHVSDIRGGQINWDLTDEKTLNYIRSKFLDELNKGVNPNYRGLKSMRSDQKPWLNLQATGYEDESPVTGGQLETMDISGMSKQEIIDAYKARQKKWKETPRKDLWGNDIEWTPEEDYHATR